MRRLTRELRRLGFGVEVSLTPEARRCLVGHASRDPRCHCLAVVGGDGTVSALVNERPTVPITILPAGTENLVARHFGLGPDPKAVAYAIAAGTPVRVDLGQTASRRFVLMAGFGFDGDIVTRHHKARVSAAGRIRTTHRIAYLEPIVRSSLAYRFPIISVRVCDPGAEEVMAGTTVFIFNLPRYALGLPFAPEAQEDDGWLDLLVFRDAGALRALYYLWKVLRGSHLEEPGVFHRRVRKVVVTADEPVPVQLDGDPAGCVLPLIGGKDGVACAAFEGESRSEERDDAVQECQSGPGWSVEVLPATLEVIPAEPRRGGSVRLPVASDGVAG